MATASGDRTCMFKTTGRDEWKTEPGEEISAGVQLASIIHPFLSSIPSLNQLNSSRYQFVTAIACFTRLHPLETPADKGGPGAD